MTKTEFDIWKEPNCIHISIKNCVWATVAPMCCIHRTGRHVNTNISCPRRGVEMQIKSGSARLQPWSAGERGGLATAPAVSPGAELKMSEIRHTCQQRRWRSWSHGPTRPSQTSCPSGYVIRSLAPLPPTPHLLVTPRSARRHFFFPPRGLNYIQTRVRRLNEWKWSSGRTCRPDDSLI